jgi:hypothetical protein
MGEMAINDVEMKVKWPIFALKWLGMERLMDQWLMYY